MRQTGQASPPFPAIRQPAHYPPLDWPVIAMAKRFPARSRTGSHRHERGQLMFALEGFVVANTSAGTWFVPRGHALWMPPGIAHDVAMHSDVVMRAVYVRPREAAAIGSECRVLKVGPLLDAALHALADEPQGSAMSGRARHLAWLVLDEIGRAPSTALTLPLPTDPRLLRVAQALVADPGSDGTIDRWCDVAGLSRRTLTRQFRMQTGLSFGDWRRRLRLVAAITRIADGETLARVAATLGYRNVAAFRAMASRYGAAEALEEGGDSTTR